MEILINERKTQTDVYEFQVSPDGKLSTRNNSRDELIEIVFENGQFAGVRGKWDQAPISCERGNLSDRRYWRVFGAVAAKIEDLEKRYASNQS
jgi:hypothetical protein